MGWKPRHHGVDTTTPQGGNHDTTRDSISSLISSHKPGKTPQGGNHDTTRDSISSLISRHKPGKTPQGGNHDTTGVETTRWKQRGTAFSV